MSIRPSCTGNGFLVSYLTFLPSLKSIGQFLPIFERGHVNTSLDRQWIPGIILDLPSNIIFRHHHSLSVRNRFCFYRKNRRFILKCSMTSPPCDYFSLEMLHIQNILESLVGRNIYFRKTDLDNIFFHDCKVGLRLSSVALG